MKKFLRAVAVWITVDMIYYGVSYAMYNLNNGMDIFGNPRPEPKTTKQNWKGNVVLGSQDYQVE